MNKNISALKASGIRAFAAKARDTEGCIGLTIGEPDFDTPDVIKEQVKKSLDENMTHYPNNNGYYFLRKAISDFERDEYGLSYDPDEIILTVGATEALYVAITSIIEPGDELIVPAPAFLLYQNIIELNGGKCVLVDTSSDGFQLTERKLADAITPRTKAVILNSPNNPTGVVYSRETLEGIHRVLADKPIFVICDDVYRSLIYDGIKYESFGLYEDMRDRIIVVQSFSKPYAMTGWRIGYIMADKPLKTVMEKLHQYGVVSIPAFVQHACVTALGTSTESMRQTYEKRRDYVYNRLVAMGIDVIKPSGAFYLFPNIKSLSSDSEIFCLKLIDEALLSLTPGVFFGVDGYVRISYCYSDDVLEEAMNRLENALKLF